MTPLAELLTPQTVPQYVVIVTGWRGATAEHHGLAVINALTPIQMRHGPNVLLRHGRCKFGGIDLIADTVARGWNWEVDENPAEERDGKILGPARNDRMCAKGANLCLGFPGPGLNYRSGTWNCLMYAASYGIRCEVHPLHRPR